jgi:hypothetical protein
MKRTVILLALLAAALALGRLYSSLITSNTQEGFARYVLMLIGNAAAFAPFFWYAFVKYPPKRHVSDSGSKADRTMS